MAITIVEAASLSSKTRTGVLFKKPIKERPLQQGSGSSRYGVQVLKYFFVMLLLSLLSGGCSSRCKENDINEPDISFQIDN